MRCCSIVTPVWESDLIQDERLSASEAAAPAGDRGSRPIGYQPAR